MSSGPEPILRRIGEIADNTGLTVRTLRYYEEIGLIEPTARTDAGHRLYGAAAVERLYRISALRELGLSLDDVTAAIDNHQHDLGHVLRRHLTDLDERLAAENRLRGRIIQILDRLVESLTPEDTSRDLLQLLEDMTMLSTTIDRRIAILVYDDIEAAHDELTRVFGFGPGELTRDDEGNVIHGEIHAGDGEFWLHVESDEFGLHSPNHLGGASGTMAIMVDDVDAHYRHAVEQGATIRYEPVDQPYGYREYSAVDRAGHLWSFMKPLD